MIEFCEFIYGLICFAGFVANFLTIYVICVSMSSKTRSRLTSRCILNISICDLIAILNLPFFIASMSSGWSFSKGLCKFLTFTLMTEQFAKAFLLTLLGLTSYAQYRGSVYQITKPRMFLLLLSGWIPSILLACIFTLLLDEKYQCDLFCSSYFHFKETFTFVYTICVLLVPSIVLGLLLRQSRSPPFERTASTLELFELTLALLTTHILLTAGHVTSQWINTFYRLPPAFPDPSWKTRYTMIAGMIWYCSRLVFPFIYTTLWTEFRKALSTIFFDSLEYRPMARFEQNNIAHLRGPA